MIGALILLAAMFIAVHFFTHSWLIASAVTAGYTVIRLGRGYRRYRRYQQLTRRSE